MRDQGPAKQDMRRREHNPLAGTGYPHQPKATNPPPLHHLKNLTEHRARIRVIQQGGQDGHKTSG